MLKLSHPKDGAWTTVYTSTPFDREIRDWWATNCKGVVYNGHNWYHDRDGTDQGGMVCKYVLQFVYPEDATLFALRWL